MSKGARGGFFVVEQEVFHKACALGLRPAVALLILARFTGRSGVRSSASSNAIEKRTGIGRKAAREAIAALEAAGLVQRSGKPTKPVHRITPTLELPDPRGPISPEHDLAVKRAQNVAREAAKNPTKAPKLSKSDKARLGQLYRAGHVTADYQVIPRPEPVPVYLPNELVDGVEGRPSPVELIRQTGDMMMLRLLVDLYPHHRLDEWHGVDPRELREGFKEVFREPIGTVLVLGWRVGALVINWGDLSNPHRVDGDAPVGPFWNRVEALQQLGLISFVPHVVDGDGAPIYPCPDAQDTCHNIEREIGADARAAAVALARGFGAEYQTAEPYEYLAAVPAHMATATLVGIGRLTFRPKTAMTAAWLSELALARDAWRPRFAALAKGQTEGFTLSPRLAN